MISRTKNAVWSFNSKKIILPIFNDILLDNTYINISDSAILSALTKTKYYKCMTHDDDKQLTWHTILIRQNMIETNI